MKIAFIGAGSYVFGPSVLVQLLRSDLKEVELVLIDPATETVELLAEAFRSACRARGRRIEVSTSPSYKGVLAGADAVIHSAAPGMLSHFQRHREVIHRVSPGHLITEFGGVHGIAYSLSQIQFTRGLCREMRLSAPSAWLLVSANPLPRVCTAACREGVRTIGMCSVALVGYRTVWQLLTGEELDYPYTKAREALDLHTAGTNHLSWIVRLTDRRTGEDLLPRLRGFGDLNSPSKSLRMLARTGYLLAAGDDHIQDFLAPEGIEHSLEEPSHGVPEARVRRLEHLRAVAAGQAEFESLDEHPSWEEPIPILDALCGGVESTQPTLNLPNQGWIPELPESAIVEAPGRVGAGVAELVPQHLPSSCSEHNLRAVQLTEAITDYAFGDASALDRAVELDPTIVDKVCGMTALVECLRGDEP